MLIKKKYSGYWINTLETIEHWLLYLHQIKSIESYKKVRYALSKTLSNYNFTSSYQVSNYINGFTFAFNEKNQLTQYHIKQSLFFMKAMFTFTFLKFFNI